MAAVGSAPRHDSIEFSVSADDIDEAAQFAVATLQEMTVDRGDRGFTAPALLGETFELIDDVWTRVFRFSAEFVPAVQ